MKVRPGVIVHQCQRSRVVAQVEVNVEAGRMVNLLVQTQSRAVKMEIPLLMGTPTLIAAPKVMSWAKS